MTAINRRNSARDDIQAMTLGGFSVATSACLRRLCLVHGSWVQLVFFVDGGQNITTTAAFQCSGLFPKVCAAMTHDRQQFLSHMLWHPKALITLNDRRCGFTR